VKPAAGQFTGSETAGRRAAAGQLQRKTRDITHVDLAERLSG